MCSAALAAQSTTWTGADSSDWFDPANWTAGVPTTTVSATIPASTPNDPDTLGNAAACAGLTVASGATLTVAANAELTVAGSLSVAGLVDGGGVVVLAGQSTASLSGGGTLPSLRIEKNGTANQTGNLTVAGDLRLASGNLTLGSGGSFTLTVQGDASFDAGSRLQRSSPATLDVTGNVTMGALLSAGWPNVNCGGNWTGNGGGTYSGGVVTMDGGNQTIGGSEPKFPSLVIASGSSTTLLSGATGSGSLSIAGSLVSQATTTFAEDLTMSGSFDAGSAEHSFGRNITVSGAITGTGTVVATGGATANLSGGGTLPSLRIAKNGTANQTGNLTVAGDLRLASGTLTLGSGGSFTLTVQGDASFDAGSRLQRSSPATLDVTGNVTMGALLSAGWPNVNCGGNWTGNGGGPYSGSTVTMTGGNQTIGGTAPTFANLVIASGSTTTLQSAATGSGSLSIAGSLVSQATTTFTEDLTMSGSFDAGSVEHSFGRNITVSGTITGTGTVVATGGTTANLSGGGTLPSLRIEKNGTANQTGNLTVAGDLRLASGTLTLGSGGSFTLTVQGDASFDAGNRLQRSSSATLDVTGNVTMGALQSAGWPNVNCGGNWTGNGGGPYSGSTVTMTGGNQTIGGTAPTFANLVIASGSTTRLQSAATGSGSLSIAGSLVSQATTTFAEDLTMSGSFDAGSVEHSFGRNITVSGTITGTGTVVATGGTTANLSGGGTLPSLRIEKGNGTANLTGDLTVNGDLRLVNGNLTLSSGAAYALTVQGDAFFVAGRLQRSSTGTLVLEGNASFNGTQVVTPPQIACAGDWTADANFAPTSGTVIFDGDGTLSTTSGGPLSFHDVQIQAGVRGIADPSLQLAANSLVIAAGATLDAGSSTLRFLVPSLAPAGTLAVGAGGTLALPPLAIQTVGLTAIGDPASPARVTSDGTGRYGLTVTGTLTARNALFDGLDANGLVIPASTVLAAEPEDLRAVTFADPAPVAGACLLQIERAGPTNLWFVEFENPNQTPGVFNVRAPATTAPITFVNFGGDFGGDAFESDPGDLVTWTSQVLTQLASFTATPGIEEVTLDWTTTDETGVASYQLGRGSSASGPFTTVATLPVTGPGSYQFVDSGLTAGTDYFYQLAEVVAVNQTVQQVSIANATPTAASAQLGLGTAPTTPVVAGATWPDFTVRIENASGQFNPTATDTITLVPTGGPNVAGVLTQTAVAGVATFTGLSATAAGTVTFDLTAQGLTDITGLAVVVGPAAASQLGFAIAPPPTVVAGQVLPQVRVQALDAFGNVDTAFAGSVSVSATGTGALGGTLTVPVSNGIADFVDLSYDTAEAISLGFAAAGLTGVSAPLTVQAAAPTALAFGTAPPATGVAGDPLAAFTIEVRDQLGNVVTTVAPESIALSLLVGTETLQGPSSVTTANGVATVSGLVYERAETIVVRATSANYGVLDTPPIAISAAVPASLVAASTLPTIYYQNAVGQPFELQFEDAYGNVATQATETVTLTVPDLVGNLAGGLTRTPNNGLVTFANLAFDTPQTALLRFDASGFSPLEHSVAVVSGSSDLRLGAGAIRVVPAAPALSQPTSIFVDVTNAGQVNADGLVSVYLGSVDPANLLGTGSAVIGVGGAATFEIPWTPATEGDRTILAVVDNRTLTEQTPGDNAQSRLVSVGAPAEELAIAAGERIAWPGATSSVGITIRNAGASATTITGASTSSAWLTLATPLVGVTLQPGASIVALADLDVPLTATGSPLGTLPIIETIDVDVTSSTSSWSGALKVKLFDQPTGSATITVESGGQPIGGALVAFQDLPGVYTTDGSGQVTAALPPGARGIAVYKQGYLPVSVVEVVPEGASSFTVELTQGQALAIDSVEVAELTPAELATRGVALNDPVNNTAFDFVVAMRVGEPLLVPNVELPRVQPTTRTTITVERDYTRTLSTPVPEGGTGLKIYGTIQYEPGVPGRVETWIVAPGEIVVLNDFFEIAATFVNRTETALPTDIQLRQVSAALAPLPAGLALPDLDGVPQQLTQSMPDLDAGESASVEWVVRGDLPGSYQLEAGSSADLYGFGTFLTTVADTLVTQPFDVTLPSLTCEFLTPGAVTAGQTFDFGVRVTNDASSVARLVRVNLRTEDLENCTLAPNQLGGATLTNGAGGVLLATIDLGDLEPGQTATATFQLVSLLSGAVLEERIVNGCQGDPSPGVTVAGPPTISTHPVDETVCEGNSVTFSVVASGAVPITYQWRKDGNPIAGQEADTLSISPVALTDAGVYDVLISNPGGTTASAIATLTVLAQPTAAFAVSATSGQAPLIVQFTDQSTGSVTSWAWDLDGDGTTDSTDQNPSFTYAAAGTYTVSLTVNGDCNGDTATRPGLITVSSPPVVAALSGTPTQGVAPLTVQFTNGSTGANTFAWDFDNDGNVDSTAQSPSHTYTTPGIYSVALTATGPGGSNTATQVNYITVDEPVVAAFSGTPTIGTAPLTVDFTDASTGADGWAWDFDNDGNVDSTLQNPTWVYTTPGNYTVSLLATGPGGTETVTLSNYITVYEPPVIRAFTATPQTVTDGDQVTLQFDFEYGTGTIDNGVGPVVSGVDETFVPPFDSATVYTLTVTNQANDSVTAQVTVTSILAAEVLSFVATPESAPNGQPITLFSEFRGATTAVIQPGNITVSNQSTISVTPPPDMVTTYSLTVVNPLGDQALSIATVTSGAVPVIATQPVDQTEPVGGTATFSVQASAPGPLQYQWFRDGVTIAGADQETLTLTSLTPADEGSYSVSIGNPFGVVTSESAYLTVIGACNPCSGGVVRINSHVFADFSQTPPRIHAHPSVRPYLHAVQQGSSPADWRLVIDAGSARLVIGRCVCIHTGTVRTGGGSREAPGIELRSTCGIVVKRTAVLEVESRCARAGAIRILSGGDVTIDGLLINQSRGHGGASGDIEIASRCGSIRVRQNGLVFSDAGGSISLVAGGTSYGSGGDIEIAGRVVAEYRDAAPTIRIAAFDGAVRIASSRLHGLCIGAAQLRTSGVVVRSRGRTQDPGRIDIQAGQDVLVIGNSLHHFAFPNSGAVAIEMPGNRGGGTIDVRSTGGSIHAIDRAFDNANHSNQHAVNRIWAAGDIVFEASGAPNIVHPNSGWGPFQMPVADVRTVGNGTSGTNLVRSYAGQIELRSSNAVLLATSWSGAGHPGLNLLTASQGIVNGGLVLPADPDTSDDIGVSTPLVPPALYADALSLGIHWWW